MMGDRGVAIAAAAGLVARFLVRSRLNLAAIAGIVSMSAGAWILCGPGYGLATFGGSTWITTIIGAMLATRGKVEA